MTGEQRVRAPRFVVYHVTSTMEQKRFVFEHHAKAYLTKLLEKEQRYGNCAQEYTYSTIDHYQKNVVKMVKRKNLMTGKEYEEPSNTPNYCSPASEAYWSI